MSKKIYNTIFLAAFITSFACKKAEEESLVGLKKGRIVITDSIKILPDTLSYYGFDFSLWDKGYLITSCSKNQVRLLEIKNNNVVNIIPIGNVGSSNSEYETVSGIYGNENGIFVFDAKKVLRFDFKGNFKYYQSIANDTLNEPEHLIPRYFFVKEGNEGVDMVEYLGISVKHTIRGQKYYYKVAKNLSIFKKGDKYVHNYIPYEPESPYHQQRLIGIVDPVIGKLSNSGDYAIIFTHEDAILIYDKTSKNLKKKIEGKSSKFPKKTSGVPFGTRIDAGTIFEKDIKLNANNVGVNIPNFYENGKEYVFKQYRPPLGDRFKTYTEYSISLEGKEDRYLQLYEVASGQKLYEDLLIPKQAWGLLYARNTKYLILGSNTSVNETPMLYVAKIEEVD